MNQIIHDIVRRASYLFSAPLFQIGATAISISLVLELIVSLLVFLFLTRTIKNFLRDRLLARFGIDQGNREAIATIVSYAIGVLGFIIFLQGIGFNLASLAVIAGGLGVGIGISLQDVTSNFVSGLILLVDRPIKVGNYVEWQWLEELTVKGTVREISLRSTIVTTPDGSDMVLPNSFLTGNQVLNWSYDTERVRLAVPVRVSSTVDPLIVTETLLNAAYTEANVLYDPPPKVEFSNLSAGEKGNEHEFALVVWIDRVQRGESVKSSLRYILDYQLRQQGLKGEPTDPISTKNKPLSIRDLLRKVKYFENFSNLELWQLIEVGYRKRLRASEILFREGPDNF